MACVQQIRVRTSQETQLLPNQVLTEQQSLVVIKKLLAIAVSGITYLRGLFPGKAYGTKYVEDQEVMILKDDHNCPAAKQIVQWMQGCFEAIERKYLRAVILSLYSDPENPQLVTEFYQFRIQYTAKGAQMDFESANTKKMMISSGNVKKASMLLVRKLYTLMQNLGPLPDSVCISMKLAYYDDVTPQDYQPPGFKDSDSDSLEFQKEPVTLTMGEVVTPFHTLKLDMGTERHRLEQVEESNQVMEEWVLKVKEKDILPQGHEIEDKETPDDQNMDLDNTEIVWTSESLDLCHEKLHGSEEVTEMDTVVKKTSDMHVGLKRTRSGRVIKSASVSHVAVNSKRLKEKTVSEYDIPNSQETPSATKKKRKFSEPKEHF